MADTTNVTINYSVPGPAGKSAYELAVEAGFVGTQAAWLASLVVPGGDGDDGTNGLSAYELAVNAGFVGTQAAWLASLVGEDGSSGVSSGADIATALDTLSPPRLLSAGDAAVATQVAVDLNGDTLQEALDAIGTTASNSFIFNVVGTTATTGAISVAVDTLGGTFYWYLSQSATAPQQATLQSGSGAIASGSLVVDGVTTAMGPTGLAADTFYYVHALYNNGTGVTVVTETFSTPQGDVTAPTLSSPTVSVVDETTLASSVTTDEGNGTLHYVATESATAPTAAQIIAGQTDGGIDADAGGSQAVSAAGVQPLFGDVLGLIEGTQYYIHYVQEDSSSNQSNLVVSAPATPADITGPVLSSPANTSSGSSTGAGTVNTDTDEGTLYWVVTQSATSPTAAQIVAGNDHTGAIADFASGQNVTASGVQSISSTGLQELTTYYTHYAHLDTPGNPSNVASAPLFTTSSTSFYHNSWDDGDSAGVTALRSVLTDDHTDSDSGTDAILWGNDGSANNSVKAGSLFVADSVDVNSVRFKIKDVTKATAARWCRVRMENVTTANGLHINITNDATADNTRVGSSLDGSNAVWSNVTVTSIGDGWFQFVGEMDLVGDADTNGILYLYMGEANGDGSLNDNSTAGTDEIALYDLKVGVV